MYSTAITKFNLPDFRQHVVIEEEQIIKEVEKIEQKEEHVKEFADQNSMFEIGHDINNNKEVLNPNLITITKDELNTIIEKAKNDAIKNYIPPVKDEVDDSRIYEKIVEIKDMIDLEMNELFDKILSLAYSIAGKIVDVNLLHISEEAFTSIIKKKVKELNFQSPFSIEIKNAEVANLLAKSGIEVSVNDDMISGNYKINWFNGFLERNASEVALKIENVLIKYIKQKF